MLKFLVTTLRQPSDLAIRKTVLRLMYETLIFQNVVEDRCTAAARLVYSLFLKEVGDKSGKL